MRTTGSEDEKSILIIDTVPMRLNGITSNIMQTVKQCKDDYYFSVICNGSINPKIAEELSVITKDYHCLPDRKKHIKKYASKLKDILKNHNYDIVHIHGNSATMLLESRIVKRNSKAKIIVHCHNTTCKHKFLNKILSKRFNSSYDVALACSKDAGKWLYTNRFTVVSNTIEADKYSFKEEVRNAKRKELKIENCFVVGHVGLFNKQKNHAKLFSIFNKVLEQKNNAILLCVTGDKNIPNNIKELIKKFNLSKKIIVLKNRSDVNELMQAMDCFVFPSLHEGLGTVLLEAQASGLDCFVSDRVPKEVAITKKLSFIPLEEDDNYWANIILEKTSNNTDERKKVIINKNSKYNAKNLKNIYGKIYS